MTNEKKRKVLSSYSSILLPDPFDISVDQKENNRGSDRPFTKFSANFERMREEVSLSEEEVNNLYQIISNISSQIEKQNFMEKLDYHWHLGYIDLRSDIMNPTNNNNINEDSNNPINIYNIAKTLRVVSSFFGEIKNQSLEPYLQIVQNIKANPTSNYKFVINMASIYYFPGYFRFSSVIHKRKAKNLIDGVWKCYNKKWVVKYKATSDKSRSQHVKIQSLTIENWDYLLTVDKWKYSLKLREWSKSIPENELFCYPVFLSQDNDILAVPSLGIVRTDEYSFYCMYYPYHLFFSI